MGAQRIVICHACSELQLWRVEQLDISKKTLMNTLEFYLNDFCWISQIQWIMIKSKSGIVTKAIAYLATNTFPTIVMASTSPLLLLGRNLLPGITLNRHLTRITHKDFIFITSSANISIAGYRASLVTIPLNSVNSEKNHIGKTPLITLLCLPIHQVYNLYFIS